ncbi:MAG: hypothetical protein PUI41_09620 [Lachnospiraceae bacterium]|nr:hypothetical protein [Lachnospiraceae bacterium]MDD7051159.1 hypothetical protein [Lachnospiraceae bacterium]MDY4097379.1 hypothetical protein [Lachnospiraceae bacterium]
MADWNDIKRAFEREMNKQEEDFHSNEEKLLHSIANYLGANKGVSVVKGYKTDEVLQFLQKSVPEIKSALGGEWESMEDSAIETLVYTLTKKVKKSADFLG